MRKSPRLYEPGAVAARVGNITRSGVVWLIDTGRLPAIRTRHGVRLVPEDAVEALRREREVGRHETKRASRG